MLWNFSSLKISGAETIIFGDDKLNTTDHAITFFLPRWDINILRPRQNCCHFADDIFRCIFFNQNGAFRLIFHWSLFLRVKKKQNNIPSLVQIIAWHRPGDKPLSEPMMVRSLTHICVTQPKWVNNLGFDFVRWKSHCLPLGRISITCTNSVLRNHSQYQGSFKFRLTFQDLKMKSITLILRFKFLSVKNVNVNNFT